MESEKKSVLERELNFCFYLAEYFLKTIKDAHKAISPDEKTKVKETRVTKLLEHGGKALGGVLASPAAFIPLAGHSIAKTGGDFTGSIAKEAVNYKNEKCLRRIQKKIADAFPLSYYHTLSEIVTTAAILLFRSYECQFSNVVTDEELESPTGAMSKLAEDTVQRFFNYLDNANKEILESFENLIRDESQNEKKISYILTAIYQGPSTNPHSLRYRYTKDGKQKRKKIKTSDLFDKIGYKVDKDYYYVLKSNREAEFGFLRFLHDYDSFFNPKNYESYSRFGKCSELAKCCMSYPYLLSISDIEIKQRKHEVLRHLNTYTKDLVIESKGADIKEGCQTVKCGSYTHSDTLISASIPNILPSKWWPEDKILIKSLHQRRLNGQLLVEELHNRILSDENRMTVICESTAAAKLSGMGGVGKTLTATWYAHHYEQEYNHIIWIDCGEGSLLKSFKTLAEDLEVKRTNEMVYITDYSRKCYEILAPSKCLLVYDNAENYKGKDGLISILPKRKANLYCLITSRSQDWGIRNIGFGKITDFPLDIFGEDESLQFLEEKLTGEIDFTGSQLKELSYLLGNLPLALQLAVATLIDTKMKIQKYIYDTKKCDLGNIFELEFDAYEKTISRNISVALEAIKKENYGEEACNVLMIFGYVRPDNIQGEFLKTVLHLQNNEIKAAINLLSKYSLIEKRELEDDGESDASQEYIVSIHRLLQQVIRYKGAATKEETLRKIFSCNGFLDYKFVPFTKYASKDLQSEYPIIKAELLDQAQLKRLIKENRFEEATQLAKYIDDALNLDISRYNYAICLQNNGNLEDAASILEDLYNSAIIPENEKKMDMWKIPMTSVQMGILGLNARLTKDMIAGQLLMIQMRLGYKHGVEILLNSRKTLFAPHSSENVGNFLKIINLPLTNNYSLQSYDDPFLTVTSTNDFIRLRFDEVINKIELTECIIDSAIALPKNVMELILDSVSLSHENGLIAGNDISSCIPHNVTRLILRKQAVCIEKLASCKLDILDMTRCSVNLISKHSFGGLSIRNISLTEILFIRNGENVEEISVNELLSFGSIEQLLLNCCFSYPVKCVCPNQLCSLSYSGCNSEKHTKLSINLGNSVCMDTLSLGSVTVVDWKEANWKLKKFNVQGMTLMKAMKLFAVKEMTIAECKIDLFCLPQTIEKLSIDYSNFKPSINANDKIDLPRLSILEVRNTMDLSFISYFNAPNLNDIDFKGRILFDAFFLPEKIQDMKIKCKLYNMLTCEDIFRYEPIGTVNTVYLSSSVYPHNISSQSQLYAKLSCFQVDTLIVDEWLYEVNCDNLMNLIKLSNKGNITTIVVGRLKWRQVSNALKTNIVNDGESEVETAIRNGYVDRVSKYYRVQNGSATAIEEDIFNDLCSKFRK